MSETPPENPSLPTGAQHVGEPSGSLDQDGMEDRTPALPGGLRIRCPHCHNTTPIAVAQPLSDVTCPACGSKIGLVGGTGNDRPERGRGPEAGQRIGHFELVERLGAGGFGEVWKASDTQLDRAVAVKLPHRNQLGLDEAENFLREARAAAQLRHPHIVTVYEVGVDDQCVYIVSDFIEGFPLDRWLADHPPSYRDSARLCIKIAGALHHAHQHGVIHRDLKPSNIMIDRDGEPHLMDFGLAKRDTGEITMTLDGQILGTPAYMSPEQAKGQAHAADPCTDVYSLGVILFEMLTRERPFRGDLRMMLKQVIEDEPPSPRKLNGHVPRDLETICLKCLQKEPVRRYASAKELSEELARFLAGTPIRARPVTQLERFGRWCRRNPLVAGSAALAIVGLLFGSIAASLGYLQASRALADIRRAQQRAEANLGQAREAVDALFTRVSEETLLNQPGMQPVRRDLLHRARTYYEKFLANNSDDPTLRDELALAHFRVGLIGEEVDSPTEAMRSYDRAKAMQIELVDSDPDNPDRLRVLGDTLNAMGRALHKQQQLDRARELYSAAIDIRSRVASLAPERGEHRRVLANSHMNRGLLEMGRDTAQARTFMDTAQVIRQKLLADSGDDPKTRRDLAMGYYNLAKLTTLTGDRNAAAGFFDKARTLFGQLIQTDRDDLALRYQLAVCLRSAGDLKCATRQWEDGLCLYTQACQQMRGLAERNPSVTDYQAGLAEVYMNLALAEYELGRHKAAMISFSQAREILAPLVDKYAEVAQYRQDLVVTLEALAKLHPDAGQRAEAVGAIETLQRQWREIAGRMPADHCLSRQIKVMEAIIQAHRSAQQKPIASTLSGGH